MDRPPTYVIVLTWNGWEDTRACLQSLLPVVSRGCRVLVVDNGSSDGTPDRVRRMFPSFEIVETGANLGFAAGNNVGIRHALNRGARYVVLLNNDTVADPSFVDALLDAAEEHPEAGLLSAKIYFLHRPDVLWFAGGTFSRVTGRSVHVGYGERDSGRYDAVREIDRPCGCAMMATRRFLDEVGLMEERLFLYGEEVDWALRGRKNGFRVLFVPGSRVWHKVSPGMGGERSGNVYYYSVRNTLWTLKRHVPCRLPLVSGIRVLMVTAVYAASLFTMGIDRRNGLRSIAGGAVDYLRGKSGERGA